MFTRWIPKESTYVGLGNLVIKCPQTNRGFTGLLSFVDEFFTKSLCLFPLCAHLPSYLPIFLSSPHITDVESRPSPKYTNRPAAPLRNPATLLRSQPLFGLGT